VSVGLYLKNMQEAKRRGIDFRKIIATGDTAYETEYRFRFAARNPALLDFSKPLEKISAHEASLAARGERNEAKKRKQAVAIGALAVGGTIFAGLSGVGAASAGASQAAGAASLVGPATGTIQAAGVQASGAVTSAAIGSGAPTVSAVAIGGSPFIPSFSNIGGAAASEASKIGAKMLASKLLPDAQQPYTRSELADSSKAQRADLYGAAPAAKDTTSPNALSFGPFAVGALLLFAAFFLLLKR
jgi:hypothetical protein